MQASTKSPEVESLIKSVFGIDRVKDIAENTCTMCRAPAVEFRDALSAKEYTISGMCQKCQDRFWG